MDRRSFIKTIALAALPVNKELTFNDVLDNKAFRQPYLDKLSSKAYRPEIQGIYYDHDGSKEREFLTNIFKDPVFSSFSKSELEEVINRTIKDESPISVDLIPPFMGKRIKWPIFVRPSAFPPKTEINKSTNQSELYSTIFDHEYQHVLDMGGIKYHNGLIIDHRNAGSIIRTEVLTPLGEVRAYFKQLSAILTQRNNPDPIYKEIRMEFYNERSNIYNNHLKNLIQTIDSATDLEKAVIAAQLKELNGFDPGYFKT